MDKLGILNGFNIYSKNIMNNSYNDKKWREINKIKMYYFHYKNDDNLGWEKFDDEIMTPMLTIMERRGIRGKYPNKWERIYAFIENNRIDPTEKLFILEDLEEKGFGKFRPWVMVNISPKWTNIDQINWKLQCTFFKQIIENRYKKWERYVDKCEYVLEPGKSGSHLHAHIMLRCASDFNEKSFRTWINKGNLTQQFRTEFLKCQGFQGAVEARPAFQTKLVLNEEIYTDTLNYLSEDMKSEDHANDFTIMPWCPLRVSL